MEYYIQNAWAKYGITKVLMNAKELFFFKFDSKRGMEDVLNGGPWMIHYIPIILKPWTINTSLLKEDNPITFLWLRFLKMVQALLRQRLVVKKCLIHLRAQYVWNRGVVVASLVL